MIKTRSTSWVLTAAAVCWIANSGRIEGQQNPPPESSPPANSSTSESGQTQQVTTTTQSGTAGKANEQAQTGSPGQAGASGGTSQSGQPNPQSQPSTTTEIPESQRQPKRILGVMPNYRAVSAGEIPPPPTPRQAFTIASQNSFDYSSFFFVGITSLLAEANDAHSQLGKGVPGFGRYYWRGFLDKTDGNYLVIFALPTVFHQDERYYARGKGGIWKRGVYAATRVLITPNYGGHNSVNFSELLGRGIAQGVSATYYPSHARTGRALSERFAYAIGRDALTNVFREFWPDIATHVLHRHP